MSDRDLTHAPPEGSAPSQVDAAAPPSAVADAAAPPSPVERARAALHAPPASSNAGLWFLVSMALFVLAGSGDKLFNGVVLAVVVLIHEAGHALAMKVFGYRDLKIFFIPFFGGAASGKKTGAPAWQQSIVLFAGPLPGIGIGAVLAIAGSIVDDQRMIDAASTFIFVNGFNLLPFPPLDGGRLFEIALFARHRILETAFLVVSGVTLAAMAIGLQAIGLGFLAFLALVTIPYRARVRRQADAIRAQHGTLPDQPDQVSDDALVALDAASALVHPEGHAGRVATIRNLWEQLAAPPPRALTSVLIVGAWCASVFVLALAIVVYVAVMPKPPDPPVAPPEAPTHAPAPPAGI